jgi:malto-oligosyltrehalose trehalohydrolase
MQFGTMRDGDGFTFRIWAPSAEHVDVALFTASDLTRAEKVIPLKSESNGWFSALAAANPGDQYQFVIDHDLRVPDPASRYQPEDVHGKSQLVDPEAFQWNDGNWRGQPWSAAVVYVLNLGTFSEEGTFEGLEKKLDYLVSTGITAIEIMPIADFPGRFGWGYDGVLPFAPEGSYGRPEDLKSLVQAAHQRGLMIFLDVVYNHFGPEGNYLHAYAKKFFTEKHKTPWGAAINYDDVGSEVVRAFFIQNALYWLEEYHFDGLRLDAVHAIKDDSKLHVLKELANAVAAGPGANRQIHLILENDDNTADYLKRDAKHHPEIYTAQWDDDIHHCFHVLATGEKNGYYADYTLDGSEYPSIVHLGRCLTQGFTYQGQPSKGRDGEPKGQPSKYLPPTAFVSFIQNHDQIGNRAFGDRIASLTSVDGLRAISAGYLLAPLIPMLYMGEEWGSKTPFYYFCDVGDELAPLVTAGRRKEFEKFPEFSKPENREKIPDPCVIETFKKSKLNWSEPDDENHSAIHNHYKKLIQIRKEEIVPLLDDFVSAEFKTYADSGIFATWNFGVKKNLHLLANFSNSSLEVPSSHFASHLQHAKLVFSSHDAGWNELVEKIDSSASQVSRQSGSAADDFESLKLTLEPWSTFWFKS